MEEEEEEKEVNGKDVKDVKVSIGRVPTMALL